MAKNKFQAKKATNVAKAAERKPSPSASRQKKADEIISEPYSQRPLTPLNFYLMIGSGVLIIVGFLLMLGGSSTADGFNPDIFSTRRIVIGPGLAFLGFVAMGVAIIVRPCKKKKAAAPAEEASEKAAAPAEEASEASEAPAAEENQPSTDESILIV